MDGVRPKVDLEWVASPDEITLDGTPTVTNNSDEHMISLNSKLEFSVGHGNVIFMCRATGHDFTSETEVYLLNQDEISLETTSSRSNNNDGTFNIKCSSHFGFLSRSMEQVTLECRVFDGTTNTSLDVTTVELFLPEYQESDCTSQWSPGLNTLILLLMTVFLICRFITLKRTLKAWESVKIFGRHVIFAYMCIRKCTINSST
ncbi:hypothetical protein BSL78_12810 [Apostichopus japonicus]|uniref:Uncharacterized protein n=1 Tax=Stichopus japonicus TaxID=307972 RepID=A0A2G8KQS3_STIJA|nr:hypothetical protein BSL78_12810 [Apostichopus japonicus]